MYQWEGRKRRGGKAREKDRAWRAGGCLTADQSMRGRSVTCFQASGEAASHTPGQHSISAAGSRGLDMIFSSVVSSARLHLSLIFACLDSCSTILLYTACSWQHWLVVGLASSRPFSQDIHAFFIKLVCLITSFAPSPSMIIKTTSKHQFRVYSD